MHDIQTKQMRQHICLTPYFRVDNLFGYDQFGFNMVINSLTRYTLEYAC